MPDAVTLPPLPPAAQTLASAAQTARTVWRGGDTVWRRWGSGRPTVLLHGGFGSWTHWLRTIPALAGGRLVLVPDMPGFGESDDPAEDDALVAIPGALLAGLEQIAPLDNGVDVLGFSFGTVMAGALAALLNEAHPGVLRRLVLTAPAGLGMPTKRFDALASTRPDMTEADFRALHRENLGVIMIADTSLITDETIDLQIINTTMKRVSGKPYSRSDALVRACRDLPLDRIDAIWGTRDAYASRYEPDYTAQVRALHPNIRIHNIEGAGHWLPYEAPDAYNAILKNCLDED